MITVGRTHMLARTICESWRRHKYANKKNMRKLAGIQITGEYQMNYIEIRIETAIDGIEPVLGTLLGLGITDTVVEDPRDVDALINKEHDYDWDYLDDEIMEMKNEIPSVTVYMEDTDENRQLTKEVEEAIANLKTSVAAGDFGPMDFGTLETTVKMEDDSQWKDKWKEYFKPAKVGKKIVVKPTWEEYEPKPEDLIIEIDPGVAFGTGTHETTSLCIKMLEKYTKKGDQVLDVGCGSGILAIAAALLEAGDVLGIEIDPIAVEVGQENVALNKVDNIVKVQYGDLTKGIDYKADVVVANLMADLVMMLSESVAKHMKEDGVFISSGILVEKRDQVAEHLQNQGFEIVEIKEDGMWCCIVAKA